MRERYGEIAKAILITVGLAGVVVVVAAAPNVLLAAKPFVNRRPQFAKKQGRQKATRTFRRLEKNNLLKIKEKNRRLTIELTKEGKRIFRQIQAENLEISKPPRWDGKWRIVIFDIPEEVFRPTRNIFRAKLKQWEFYPLQKSVWVCPWPCEKEIQSIGELYEINKYINIAVADKIMNDTSLRKHFGLLV